MQSGIIKTGNKVIMRELTNQEESKENDIPCIIAEVSNKETVKLSITSENASTVSLEIGHMYRLEVYTLLGIYNCEAMLMTDIREEQNMIEMKIITELERIQRRQFYRVMDRKTIEYRDVTEEETEWNKVMLYDISGGGIRFHTDTQLESDRLVEIRMSLVVNQERFRLVLQGNLLSSEPLPNHEELYENRVIFTDLPIDSREIIIKYIFELERLQRRREKGLA